MLATSMLTFTVLFSGASASKVRSMSYDWKVPVTGVKKCLTEKLISVCAASTFQARSSGTLSSPSRLPLAAPMVRRLSATRPGRIVILLIFSSS